MRSAGNRPRSSRKSRAPDPAPSQVKLNDELCYRKNNNMFRLGNLINRSINSVDVLFAEEVLLLFDL